MKNLKWYEDRGACSEAMDFLLEQPSLEAAWARCPYAGWALWLVAHLPILVERCRRVSAELARQFALSALDSAHVTGPAVEALRACAPVTDEATACAVERAARDASSTAAAAYDAAHYARDADAAYAAVGAAVGAARDAAHYARDADAAYAAVGAAVGAARDAADYARDAADYARDAAYYACAAADYACAAESGAGEAEDRRLAELVRAAIPWDWVCEACAVDAPELLEVA